MQTSATPDAPEGDSSPEADAPLTQDQREEVRLARRCFSNIDQLSQQLLSYPPGHPAIEGAIDKTYESFYAFFQITDRLSVQIHPHSLVLMGTEEEIWETDEPRDYCFLLSRDGFFLLHLLAGIDRAELKRFVEVLNTLVDERNNISFDSANLFFEANFRYLSYDILDESLAALAGIDLDSRNKDTKEEKELIEDLFNQAFEDDEGEGDAIEGNFEIRVQNPAEKLRKIEVGSREFLDLEEEAQRHLAELKQGFIEHAELEHREGEMLSAILGAKPKEKLRVQAVKQVGEVMGQLITTDQPWEALTFLKLIHQWRDKFSPEVAGELKSVVAQCFDTRQIQELVRQAARAETKQRRMILQMFNALHLDEASAQLARVVGWGIEDEARDDILRYLRERGRHGFDFLKHAILEIDDDYADPVYTMLEQGMPRSRPVLLHVLDKEVTPPLKARALNILEGSWDDPRQIRDLVVPLVTSGHSELRIAACRTVAEATPQHIVRVMSPLFDDQLRRRDEEEVRELAQLYVTHGKQKAVETLKNLIHRRGLTTSEEERELAVTVARALIRTPNPAVIEMLEEIGKDWLVPQRIRSACKEIADILRTGSGG